MTDLSKLRVRLVLLILLSVAIGNAQESRLTGVAVDPSGATIELAIVELSGGTDIQCTRTDVAGEFEFEDVAPGSYFLSVTAPDFEPCIQELYVDGSEISVECVLELAIQTQSVEIVADDATEPSTDPTDNADQVTLDTEDINALPALDGDVIGALQQLLGDGSFGSDGGGLVVDGMETDDLGVSATAIQEIRINKDPYSAEFSRPGNSRIEVITKQGAESFHGQVNLRMRNQLLDARNAYASERPDQRRLGAEGHIVGPIGSGGKHSFLLSAEHDRDRQAQNIFARTLDGTVQQAVLAPEVETEMSARWNYHPNYEHALALRYEWEHESESNRGVGGFSLPEVASNQTGTGHELYWNYRRVFGASSLMNWTGKVGRESERDWSLNSDPRIVVQDAFTSGGAQRDGRENAAYVESAGVFSYQKGKHQFRTGILLRDMERVVMTDRNNFGGTFRFATLADFEANRPLSYSFRAGDPSLTLWNVAVAGFVQDNIRVTQRSTLALGIRYDRQQYSADPNNFAPRASFAIALGEHRKTTIRVGGGVFYDNIGSGAYEDRLRFDGLRMRDVLLNSPSYPDPLSGIELGDSLAPNLVTWAPELPTPYVVQYSAGVERQVAQRTVLSVRWTNSVGIGLLRSRDLNAPLPNLAVRPDSAIGIHRQLEASAREERYGLRAQLRGRLNKFFQGTVRYRWGRAYNDVSDDDDLPANSRDLTNEWGPAGSDRRHSLDVIGSVNVKDWFKLGVILEADSSTPYTVTTGLDDNGDGLTGDRPVGVGRNTMRGVSKTEVDMRVSRTFDVPSFKGKDGDPTRLSLTVDAFNLLNTVNHRRFVGNMSSPLFGLPTAAGSARRMQVGLRWRF